VKLIIEIDLDKVSDSYYTGRPSMYEAADLVALAAERVRSLNTEDVLTGSWRLKNENDRTVGSITVQGDDDDD
jgi:hypothetical protein